MLSQSAQRVLSDQHDECSLCYVLEYQDWQLYQHAECQGPYSMQYNAVALNVQGSQKLFDWTSSKCLIQFARFLAHFNAAFIC